MNTNERATLLSNQGFTLVEMMVAVLISAVIMGAVYAVYQAQQRSMVNQQSVSAMQQELRSASVIMEREIREAGLDPFSPPAGAGVTTATVNSFGFTRDLRGDAINPNEADGILDDPDENVTYSLLPGQDANGDGIVDGGGGLAGNWSVSGTLGRNTGVGVQTLTQNVDAIEFNYLLEDGTQSLNPPNPNLIRGVQVSILMRTDRADPNLTRSLSYITGSGQAWNPPNDGFRRRLNIMTIFCRNLEI